MAFIVLEGLDGSGKATQTKLLVNRLSAENFPVVGIDFPRYTNSFFGAFIGECLAGTHGDFVRLDPHITSALYALDRHESAAEIKSWSSAGKIVIADRFASSNQIHQGGKISNVTERETFLTWLDRMEHEVLEIPRPDATIYLRVPVTVTLDLLNQKREQKNGQLRNAKDIVESDQAYIESSHACAQWLTSRQPSWHVIECTDGTTMRTRESIHEDVYATVTKVLQL